MLDFQYQNLHEDALKFRLYQIGTVTDVYDRQPDGTDRLNNEIKVFRNVGETIVFAHWSGATDEERDPKSGEFNKVTPTFLFPSDSVIVDDAHLFYNGIEYEITATTSRGNHIVADGKEVHVLSTDHAHVTAEDQDGEEISLPIEP